MEELDDGVMGPFPGVSCQHVYATQSAAPKNSSVKHVLSDLEDNNCIDGRGQDHHQDRFVRSEKHVQPGFEVYYVMLRLPLN